MANEVTIYQKEGGIATLTLNRPEKLNAVTRQLAGEARAAIEDAGKDPAVRVLLITGAGRAFCAGLDMREAASGRDVVTPDSGILQRPAGALDLLLQKVDKPTIAAVNGPAIGMGCDLALACDMRLGSENASFGELYVKRGMVPSAGCYYLPRLVGLAKAMEVLLFGDLIEAKEAERMGLLNKLVPQAQLMAVARQWASRLAQSSPVSVQFIKKALWVGQEASLERMLEFVTLARTCGELSDDAVEGVKAYVEKREPVFTGRRKKA